jgi:hypothetical protein
MKRRRNGASHTGTTPGNEGRYEGYDVLAQQKYWDDHTREVVLGRMEDAQRASERLLESLQFFSREEARTVEALTDQLLAQFDDPKIPVVHLVDQRLAKGETDGWRYEDLPEDGEAWRRSMAALDEDSAARFGRAFADCSRDEQAAVIVDIVNADSWHGWKSARIWSLWTRYACAAFYGHPWAWNEIGFGGPAYPRGYKVLRVGWREPWERPEADADDPVPWANRAEEARKHHEEFLPTPPAEGDRK